MRFRRTITTLMLLFSLSATPALAQQEQVRKTVKLGAGVQYQLVEKNASDGPRAPDAGGFFRVSADGGRTYGRLKPRDPVVRLKSRAFDPLLQDGEQPAAGDTYLVQLEIQPLAEFKTRIEAAGGEVIGFVPPQTYVVRASAGSIRAIDALAFVRWSGPYAKAYRTTLELANTLQSDAAAPAARYRISLFSRDDGDVDAVVERIRKSGGRVVMRSRVASSFIEAELDGGQLSALLEHDNVQFVEPWTPPENDLDIVRRAGGSDYIETQVPHYTGQGVTGEVLDDAIWNTHQGFVQPRLHGEVDIANAHGTPVYGIVFGTGGADPLARGLLPDGDGVFASWTTLTDRAAHTAELVDPDGGYRAVFQSNSWGGGRTTEYTAASAEMDQIIFDNDLVITQSQSNAGDRQSRPQAWAKNVVSVGGIRHRNTADFSDDAWLSGASIGPAADGRIKPDLAHFYDYVFTTHGSGDTAHTQFSGTSASTPIVAGHFGLTFAMWADGIFTGEGLPGTGGDVFAARPRASTARALVINTARQYPFTGTEHDLTRVHQGWGLPDVRSLYDAAGRNGWQLPLVVDEEHALADQQRRQYMLHVSDGEVPPWLKATMVYMDPPGNPAAAVATVNDLTLRLTAPGGAVYWGNAGLLEGNWSVSGGSPSTVDTVENVFIEQAEPGEWTVEVIADRIVDDARVETPETDADYALVVTCGGENRCTLRSGNASPSVAVVSPEAGSVFTVGDDIGIAASAEDIDGTITAVEFFVNGVSAGTDSEAPYSVTWNAADAGTLELTAAATDDGGARTLSEAVTVQVDATAPPIACRYSVNDEWDTGFVAVVTITNNGTDTVQGWEVRWEYPAGVTIVNSWNAQLTGSNPYTAEPLSWNGAVGPGQSVEFGLQGAKAVSGAPAPVPQLTGTCSA